MTPSLRQYNTGYTVSMYDVIQSERATLAIVFKSLECNICQSSGAITSVICIHCMNEKLYGSSIRLFNYPWNILGMQTRNQMLSLLSALKTIILNLNEKTTTKQNKKQNKRQQSKHQQQ